MTEVKAERLDLNARYWHANAQHAIRDIYDALVELITNADDRYVHLESQTGRIEIEVERRRKEAPTLIRVRDFADGMTLDVMRQKIKRVGARVSGMERGEAVRGTNSRGAKDIAVLGGVTFESIASEDGQHHRCEITAQGRFLADETTPKGANLHRKRLGIRAGSGTLVTICVNPEHRIPQHDTLRADLSRLIQLRDILCSENREIFLHDINQNRRDRIRAQAIEGHDRLIERFKVPGYEGAEAKLVIKRVKARIDDRRPRFRLGAILIKSRHSIHESTMLASDLENDPNAAWFFGRLNCDYIETLWNDYDERFEKGLPPTPANPRPILDPNRREGLSREHPFVQALFAEALKRFRPLVEEERKQSERQQARIESEQTRKRLDVLERAAARFMNEQREDEDDTSRSPDDSQADSPFRKKGYSLNPPFAQLLVGHSQRFWFNINQLAFPELSAGDSVEITCATDDISSDHRFALLEPHPSQQGVLRCVWKVTGEKATAATAIKARVGSIVAESVIEVLQTERDRYQDVQALCFSRKRYLVRTDLAKVIEVRAPYPGSVREPTAFELVCTDSSFHVRGERVLIPVPELGIARCRLRATADKPGRKATLTATVLKEKCEAEIISVESPGTTIRIELKDRDYGNQRYKWTGNVLEIAARHPSLNRYLGPPDEFPGQEEKHFRLLLAEIVAEAVCALILSKNAMSKPEEYQDADWDAYYAEYTKLLTKFLPIAHDSQVKL